MQCSVFIAASLDGYIARPDGNIDWLNAAGSSDPDASDSSPEDYGYQTFFDSVDCMVMGRGTLETVLGFGLEMWPYEGKRVVVLSRSLTAVPPQLTGKVELHPGPPADLVARLAADGHRRAYVDGGQTIQSFLRAGLITDMVITTIPILLGAGRPLFGPTNGDIHLRHVTTAAYPNGFVQSTYRVQRD